MGGEVEATVKEYPANSAVVVGNVTRADSSITSGSATNQSVAQDIVYVIDFDYKNPNVFKDFKNAVALVRTVRSMMLCAVMVVVDEACLHRCCGRATRFSSWSDPREAL